MLRQLAAPPTTAGLTTSDLIALLSVLVVIFGLLLTAIGVLVLRSFDSQARAIAEVKRDAGDDVGNLRAEMNNGFTALWGEFRWLRGFLVDKRPPETAPEAAPTIEGHTGHS